MTTGKGLSSVEKAAAKLGDGAAFTLKPPVEDVSLAPSSTRTELPSAEATLVREAAQAPVKAPAAKPDTNHSNDAGRKCKHV